MKKIFILSIGIIVLLAVSFVGCDTTGSGVPIVIDDQTVGDLRALDSEVFSRKALSYSGFREGQSPEDGIYPSKAEILEDLQLLAAKGFGLIRVFSSGQHGRDVIEVIDDSSLDIKVQLGAYVSGTNSDTANLAELDEAIDLANDYKDIVVAVSVGNETLVDWSFVSVDPADLVTYIRRVRSKIEQPVTVNDNWAPFAMGSGYDTLQVWKEIDYASIHTYAYWDSGYNLWDWQQSEISEGSRARAMMDAALAHTKKNFSDVRNALMAAGIDIPIVIGETGWQSVPSASIGSAQYLGHPVNQSMFYNDIRKWAYGSTGNDAGDGFTRPAAVFYFAAFDEPWKQSDDNWGLWDKDRNEKYVLSRSGFSLSDAVYFTGSEDAIVVTEDRFVVFRDADEAAGEFKPDLQWNAWENGTTASIATGDDNPPEGETYAIVNPTPAGWGWGMTLGSGIQPYDLSAFSSGSLKFSVKTTYPGKIEIGFFTGNVTDQTGVDVYLTVDPANNSYGYANDGNWHEVVIPISAIVPNAAPAYEQPSSATMNMEEIFTPFVIGDRFEVTGNPSGAKPQIALDNIRWEK
ncbi:glycosyl hydrolase family 17 protein [Spirochaeta dissipatitropha]